MPEEENYEMYLSAFIEDVQDVECVTQVVTNGNNLVITIENESDFEQLHLAVKHLLSNSFHDKLVSDSGFSKVA